MDRGGRGALAFSYPKEYMMVSDNTKIAVMMLLRCDPASSPELLASVELLLSEPRLVTTTQATVLLGCGRTTFWEKHVQHLTKIEDKSKGTRGVRWLTEDVIERARRMKARTDVCH